MLYRDLLFFSWVTSGERGIRTPGPVTVNSFQDCRNRPLCQLSAAKVRSQFKQQKKFQKSFIISKILFRFQPIPLPEIAGFEASFHAE
jgi:hypothetical protein